MSSEFGNSLKITVFGESHGKAVGVVVDGLPAGETINYKELDQFLERRRPGKSALSTARNEADRPVFLSGVSDEPLGLFRFSGQPAPLPCRLYCLC